jgi:hypothetical protein
MKKSINPQALEIQRRFFEALDLAISAEKVNGLKGFCVRHNLNRTKYSRIKSTLNKPVDEMRYKIIDIDALMYLCQDFGVSSDWLLLGHGKMEIK